VLVEAFAFDGLLGEDVAGTEEELGDRELRCPISISMDDVAVVGML